jgi:hypothetical protein
MMVALQLPEEVMEQLQAIAEREQRSPAEVVADLLKQYPTTVESTVEPGSMKALGLAARRARIGANSEPTDTSERSRDILHNEFADYLKRRMDEQNGEDLSTD